MHAIATFVMGDAGEYHETFTNLINASHKKYIDLETSLHWKLGVNKVVIAYLLFT
jgi:hypothetical protein